MVVRRHLGAEREASALNHGAIFPVPSSSCFWDRLCHWTWSLLTWLNWLDSWGVFSSPSLLLHLLPPPPPPSSSFSSSSQCRWEWEACLIVLNSLHGCWGSELMSSHLHATSPALSFHFQTLDFLLFQNLYHNYLSCHHNKKIFCVSYQFLKTPVLPSVTRLLQLASVFLRWHRWPKSFLLYLWLWSHRWALWPGSIPDATPGAMWTGKEESGNSREKIKIYRCDISSEPNEEPVFVSLIIIHHFVYKWEIAV